MEEEKRRQEMKDRDVAIQGIVKGHNVPLTSNNSQTNLVRPNLNSTQTLETSSTNHDS